MYDILLQNTASKKEYLVTGLRDRGNSLQAYVFENFQMPEGAEEGEYIGALYYNGRQDCEYTFSDDLLETEIATAEGTVKVRNLRAVLFILKYGEIANPAVASPKNNEYYYYNG